MKRLPLLIAIAALLIGTLAQAHPGRTDSKGCHKDNQKHTRHCH